MIGAFDLGTKCGYAMRDAKGGPVLSGVMDFTPSRFDSGAMRFLKFKDQLKTIHKQHPFERIYFEEVRRHKGTTAAHVYGGFWSHLIAFCKENEIPYEGVPVQEIKRFATGKGNAGKGAVIAAVESWGYCPKDDNEADALALLHLKLSEIPDVTVTEEQVREKAVRHKKASGIFA